MGTARNLARWLRFWAGASILLAAAVPAFVPIVAAQQEIHKAPAQIPRSIVLPGKLVGAAPATLAVLDSVGRLMPNAVVELSDGQKVTTDATGRALFTSPRDEGLLTARIPGSVITASSVVLSLPAPAATPAPGENPGPGIQINSYPKLISIHDQFAIAGSGFRGEADANRVFLAEFPCLVLAASPVSLVVLPGLHLPIGAMDLRVSALNRVTGNIPSISSPVSVVMLEVGGPAGAIRAGAQGALTIHARGTAESVTIDVRNASPKILQLTHGNVQRVKTSGGENNAAQIETKFLAAGDYTVTARLVAADPSLPDVDAARRTLVSASELATGMWAERLDRLIKLMERSPEDIGPIREELKAMIDDKPPGQFGTLLESAWMGLQ